METQLTLIKERNRVPATTPLSGTVIDGFRIVTASDLGVARSCISFARVTGSVGGSDFHYAVAGPEVMPEARTIERWAIVKRIPMTPEQFAKCYPGSKGYAEYLARFV